MKKKKSILHLCEATFLLLLLILISTLYLLKYLQAPGGSYSPMLHLIQLTLLFVVLTLALTLIQRELLSRLLVNAFRDITGIHNKTSLENKITELGELPSTFGIGVMMFDLNNLKHVNDTYGHEKGDEFIQTFAYCLTRILDSNSFLARYGGDEFIIIQTDTDSEHLKQMQHRLANLVHDYNNQATLTLSYATGSHTIAVISTDIENFHYINDKYGYPLGNEILNIVYDELAASSLTLFTTRVFSDVFISIADMERLSNDALLTQIQLLDKRICRRIQDTYHISFFRTNSGICCIPDPTTPPETLISYANVARRLAKKMISHCCIYSDEIDRQEKMQTEILHSFHPALEHQEFEIYFQPKVTPCTGAISSAEVLVRWIRNGQILWSPAIYIPLFEQNGFVISLDYYVYGKTFQWLQKYSDTVPAIRH